MSTPTALRGRLRPEDHRAARRAGGVTALVVALVLLAVPGLQRADAEATVPAWGWWTDRPTAPPAGEAGEGQPVGAAAVEVASGVDGTSVAALRVTGTGVVDEAVLVLAESQPGGPDVSVDVCSVSAPFTPTDGGALDDAPGQDCLGAITVERDPATQTWRAEVTRLVSGTDDVTLLLVPGAAPVEGLPIGGATAVVRFGGVALEVQGGGVAPTTTAAPTTTTPVTSPPPATVAPPTPAPASPSFSPTPTIAPTTTAPAVEPVSPPVDADTADELSVPSLTAGPISGGDDGAPWIRLGLLVPLSAAVGYGTVIGGRLRDAVV